MHMPFMPSHWFGLKIAQHSLESGGYMRSACKCAALVASVLFFASFAPGATISGTVKGPDGKPFKGAFVEAQDMDSRIATNVLSDKDGRYHIENLPEGQYQLVVRAVGYRFEP